MGKSPENYIEGTLLNELLEKYGFTHTSFAEYMALYCYHYSIIQTTLTKVRRQIKKDLYKYASKPSLPNADRLLIMVRLIGCSIEELLLVLLKQSHTKAIVPMLPLGNKNLNDDDLRFIEQGKTHKYLEIDYNFKFHLVERWLKVRYRYKVLIYENALTEIRDTGFHNMEENLIVAKIIIQDKIKEIAPESFSKMSGIKFDELLWRGDKVELIADLYFSEVNIENNKLWLAQPQSTELLKFSGTLLGLEDSVQIQICENITDRSLEVAMWGKEAELNREKHIILDENLSFQYETIPLKDSIFELCWG